MRLPAQDGQLDSGRQADVAGSVIEGWFTLKFKIEQGDEGRFNLSAGNGGRGAPRVVHDLTLADVRSLRDECNAVIDRPVPGPTAADILNGRAK